MKATVLDIVLDCRVLLARCYHDLYGIRAIGREEDVYSLIDNRLDIRMAAPTAVTGSVTSSNNATSSSSSSSTSSTNNNSTTSTSSNSSSSSILNGLEENGINELRMVALEDETTSDCSQLFEYCKRWWLLDTPNKTNFDYPTTPRFLYGKKGRESKDLILGIHSVFNFDPASIGSANDVELKELHEDKSGSLITSLHMSTYHNAKKVYTYLHDAQENAQENTQENDQEKQEKETAMIVFEDEEKEELVENKKRKRNPTQKNQKKNQTDDLSSVVIHTSLRRHLYQLATNVM